MILTQAHLEYWAKKHRPSWRTLIQPGTKVDGSTRYTFNKRLSAPEPINIDAVVNAHSPPKTRAEIDHDNALEMLASFVSRYVALSDAHRRSVYPAQPTLRKYIEYLAADTCNKTRAKAAARLLRRWDQKRNSEK